MTNTQLMVIPQLPALRENLADEHDFARLEEDGGETLDEVLEEVAALELRYAADCARVTKVVDSLNKANRSLLSEIETLNGQLLALVDEMAHSDDLEDQANANDMQKIMDEVLEQEDTDHETRDNEADADSEVAQEQWSHAVLKHKCKVLYRAIARITHPDKCRSRPEEEKKRRNGLFLRAKQALSKLDYEDLDAIYVELHSKSLDPLNLVQRLLRARERREALYRKMEKLRQSDEWRLFVLAFHHGNDVAHDQYRTHLLQTREGLKQLLSTLKRQQAGDDSNSNNHWV